MTITLNALQKQRRDTASNWTSNNTVLLAGEWGIESDTKKFKIGDGSTAWQSLDYVPIPDANRSLPGNLVVEGDFTVNGTTTTIDTTTLTVEDKNIELGKVSTPTDTTADGGGITLKGATDKTINWVDSTDSWTLSENLDLASGKVFKINNAEILSATGLGSSVISSSLTSVGTITSGTWNATAISGSKVTPDFGSQNIVTTGNLTVDTTTLHVDSTNNKVGIGTTDPRCKNEVYDSSVSAAFSATDLSTWRVFQVRNNIESTTGTAAGIAFGGDGSSDTETAGICGISTNSTGGIVDLAFLTATGNASSERMRILSDGKIGIGTTSPSKVLHIAVETAKTNEVEHMLQLTHTSSNTTTTGFGTGIRFQGERNNGALQTIGDINFEADVNSGTNISAALVFKPALQGSVTERMRITSGGNIKIGENNSLDVAFSLVGNGNGIMISRLVSGVPTNGQVLGDIGFCGASSNQAMSSSDGLIRCEAAADHSGTSAATDLVFFTKPTTTGPGSAPSERVRITSSGNLLIGETTSNARFHVKEDANLTQSNPHFRIEGSGYSLFAFLDANGAHIGQNSNSRSLRFYSGGNESAGVQLSAGNTSFGSYSDERLKKNIKDIGSVLDKIKDIRCISYLRKDIENFKETIGFVAQDFIGKFDQVLDSSKVRDTDKEESLAIKYTETIPILLKAIQELSAKVEALETA